MMWLLWLAATAWPQPIDNIEIRGTKWTHRNVILTEIGYQEGATVDEAQFQLGITRLWNTGIFSHVDGFVEQRDGKNVAVYEIDERFFLAPVFNFTFLSINSYWFRAGAKSINSFGRFIDIEAAYERFNVTNGGYIALKEPRLFGKRIELTTRFERLSRPRPDFVTIHTHGQLAIGTLVWEDRVWLQGGVDAGHFDFAAPVSGVPNIPRSAWHAALTGSFRLGRLDTDRLRQRGLTFEVRPVTGVVFGNRAYLQVTSEFLAFFLVRQRLNFAFRLIAGASTPVPPQLSFFIGGLDMVRGFVDNHIQTEFFAVMNAEARIIMFDGLWNWLAIMPVLFCDAVIARSSSGATIGAAAVGVGLRILFPKFPKTGIRADVAQPLALTPPQVSLGAFQFF